MLLDNICTPAFIYLIFSLVQIILDLFKGLYNTSFFKFIVMIIFTIFLNILCMQGLSIISWIIVFVPFVLMSLITAILLFVFGLNPTTGRLNSKMIYTSQNNTHSHKHHKHHKHNKHHKHHKHHKHPNPHNNH